MKCYLSGLAALILVGCGPGQVDHNQLAPEEPWCTYNIKGVCVHEYSSFDNSFCTYDIGGMCVWKRNRFVESSLRGSEYVKDMNLISLVFFNWNRTGNIAEI